MNTFSLPSAFEAADQIDHSRAVIFLDYDGTLTPIVSHPSEAKLAKSMRDTLRKLAAHFPIAVVSGRDLKDIQSLIALDGIFYAGSHGLDISGPNGLRKAIPSVNELIPLLDEKEEKIKELCSKFKGAELERKRFSFAVHYRNVAEELQGTFQKKVEKIGEHKKLKWRKGKKVLELQPNIEWDKGKALLWLLKQIPIVNPFSIYIGDDLTDEDAFKVIGENGLPIVIADEQRETSARYRLDNTEHVRLFLEHLLEI